MEEVVAALLEREEKDNSLFSQLKSNPRMSRRRPIGKTVYTINLLLTKQPKALTRDKTYDLMISYFRSSPVLQSVKFNKRCYSLLNEAVIKPEHLNNFYRTYRLPRTPFFPLFFMIKRNYLLNRELKKREKQEYIIDRMNNLPPYVVKFLKLVKDLEQEYNRANKSPVFKSHIMAKTKKKADAYYRYNHGDWILFFNNYFELLLKEYERLLLVKIEQLSACLILMCIPEHFFEFPNESLVKKHYRSFSKKYHPDTGGDSLMFLEIKKARDFLLEKRN